MAYNHTLATKICNLLAAQEEARSLRQACAIAGITASTFLYWCDNHPELAEQYARADKIATDLAFEEFRALNDEPPPKVKGFTDTGYVQWQRMRLDNKKWEMAKRRPSRYGDRIHQDLSGSVGVQLITDIPRPKE